MSHRNTAANFEEKYIPEPNSGCWLWLGALICQRPPKMYGTLKWSGKKRLAHVISYEISGRKIPPGLSLDHKCRNTMCVNPDHLEPVTHIVNCRRSAHATKTHCKHGHPYSDGFEIYVRNDNEGKQYRRCLTCYKMRYPATEKI